MLVNIDLRDRTPICVQLERGLRAAIQDASVLVPRRFGNSQLISICEYGRARVQELERAGFETRDRRRTSGDSAADGPRFGSDAPRS